MSKNENPLTEFQVRLEKLCNRAFDIANEQRRNGKGTGLAFYYFGRLVSCFMGVKTLYKSKFVFVANPKVDARQWEEYDV